MGIYHHVGWQQWNLIVFTGLRGYYEDMFPLAIFVPESSNMFETRKVLLISTYIKDIKTKTKQSKNHNNKI